jgi:hypothetical protein
LDENKGGGRPYKSEMWKQRLMTAAEKEAERKAALDEFAPKPSSEKKLSAREEAILARGGTIAK